MSRRADAEQVEDGIESSYDGSLPESNTRLNPRNKMTRNWATMAIDVPENRLVFFFTALNLEETSPICASESS